SRIGDEREAADHAVTYDIVDGAAAGVGALAGEDLEVVAVIRLPLLGQAIAFRTRQCGEHAERTDSSAFQRRPVQTIRFAVAADETLGIGAGAAAAVIVLGVFLLRIDIGERRLDG